MVDSLSSLMCYFFLLSSPQGSIVLNNSFPVTINNNQKIEPGFLDLMDDQVVQSSLLSHDAKGDPV